MKKLFVLLLITLLSTTLFAENYSEMSNEELIAIMGYVKKQNHKPFYKELKSRVSTMSDREKRVYRKNLKKIKKRR